MDSQQTFLFCFVLLVFGLSVEAALMAIPGVVGVSRLADRIIVYVESEEAAPKVPSSVADTPIQVVVVGKLKPL